MAAVTDETAPPTSLGGGQSIYQTPEWETRTRPQRHSFLDRLLRPSNTINSSTISAPVAIANSGGANADSAKERDNASGAPVAHRASLQPATATVGSIPQRRTLRQRLDRVLPPHRTYFGRSRRFLLLFVLLPLTILLLIVLPLAIGLGVGLSHHGGNGSSNLPLPSNTATFTGDLTYYEPGLGACGVTSTSNDDIVSVSHIIFDAAAGSSSNPNANPLCGKKIRIQRDNTESRKRGNSSVDVTVVDRCTGCAQADLDVSLGVFTQLADEADGRVTMSWAWLS